jgi:hypothetical protein
VAAGTYALSAKAFDNDNGQTKRREKIGARPAPGDVRRAGDMRFR